ncbi:MAG: 50S ribosomal protein L35 [Pseudomonadota bacterium]
MPKMKTNKSAAKRIKAKKSGQFQFKQGQSRHMLTLKGKKRKRQHRSAAYVVTADRENIRKLLPYG